MRQLNIVLPAPPRAAGLYVPYAREGPLLQLAGVAPTENGCYAFVGKVGEHLTLDDGQKAARLCALNLLATLRLACGDLDRVRRFMMVRGFVNATESFEYVPQVLNGASELILELFGPTVGSHARTSVGCATLPSRVAVEIDALVAVDDHAFDETQP